MGRMDNKEWTHEALVERAQRWLLNSRHCKFVVAEPKPWTCVEHPDVIGWFTNGESTVVECKISLADFRRDEQKNWRCTSLGLGAFKFYFAPPGLLRPEWMPPGVGLIEPKGRRVLILREAHCRQVRDWPQEIAMLLAQIAKARIVAIQEVNASWMAKEEALPESAPADEGRGDGGKDATTSC